MNVRHPYVLHSFSIKIIFYDKMNSRLFYFHVTKLFILEGSYIFFTRLQNVCKIVTTMQCVTNSGKTFLQPNFVVAINLGMNWSSFSFFTLFALQSNSKSRLLLYHWRGDNVKNSSGGVTGFSFVRMIGHLDIVGKLEFDIYTLYFL